MLRVARNWGKIFGGATSGMASPLASKEVLSQRTLNFHRNLLLISALSLLLWWFQDIDYGALPVIGAIKDTQSQKIAVAYLMHGFLLYNMIFYFLFFWRDYDEWRGSLRSSENGFLPEFGMYFGKAPTNRRFLHIRDDKYHETYEWKLENSPDRIEWSLWVPDNPQPQFRFRVAPATVTAVVRRHYVECLAYGLLIPALLSLAAFMALPYVEGYLHGERAYPLPA